MNHIQKGAASLFYTSGSRRLYDHIRTFPILRGLFSDRRHCALACDAQPQNGAPIFVTVHGTWAAQTAWVRRDSTLLSEFSRRWPDAGIFRFNWSGVNGTRHRLIAADVLSECLDRLATQYPSSKVLAISHSHGGNVVAWASTLVAHPLCAAVYLNTPFIQIVRSSKPSNLIMRIMLYVGEIMLLAPLALSSVDLMFPAESGLNGVALGVACALVLTVVVWSLRYVPPRIDATRYQLMSVSSGRRKISRELVAFVVGDEPSAAFGAVYLAQWLGRRAVILLIVILVLLAFVVAVAPKVESTYDEIGPWLIGCCLAIYLVFLFVATSAYGMVQGLIALDSPVTVTPAPIGQTDFATIAWTKQDRLRHSLIYDSPEATATIVNWLETVLNR